jgi:hypothetical protein
VSSLQCKAAEMKCFLNRSVALFEMGGLRQTKSVSFLRFHWGDKWPSLLFSRPSFIKVSISPHFLWHLQ